MSAPKEVLHFLMNAVFFLMLLSKFLGVSGHTVRYYFSRLYNTHIPPFSFSQASLFSCRNFFLVSSIVGLKKSQLLKNM